MLYAPDVTTTLSKNIISESPDVSFTTLDQKLISTLANSIEKYVMQKQQVLRKINNADSVTSPQALFEIQQKTADYNIEVSLISALTRKATSAVETLLRA
ncbi:type III secretion system inner rod subunit SctI [Rouxiella badensis]|uniref:type III secretion system inner rod subunit SctI n=1 Tax=Rouxiella badensis TaxID=1646377 RepID=UPI0022AAE10A|nr:type III secretion system inner rod subunit SctI [Rouxiella badensis]WAT10898.1 type III secretion system inner rod subunit SctI [Rouxiella badensis]